MSLLQSLFLGIIQGITEFLPISSSGHLILVEKLLGLNVEELKSFDVALHFGTLMAILVYFRRDFLKLLGGLLKIIQNAKLPTSSMLHLSYAGLRRAGKTQNHNLKLKTDNAESKLIGYLIIGSIPAVMAGVLLEDFLDANFRNALSVGIMMMMVGILFIIIEYWQSRKGVARTMVKSWKQSLIIGLAQALALIPGVSRSGATMATGIAQGIKREESARFSFLLGSIAIAGAAGLTLVKIILVGANGRSPLPFIGTGQILIGFIAAAISGFIAISFLMNFLKKYGLTVFGVYRIIMGIVILSIF